MALAVVVALYFVVSMPAAAAQYVGEVEADVGDRDEVTEVRVEARAPEVEDRVEVRGLAVTGGDAVGLAVLGVLAVGVGSTILLAGRRRRSAD